MNNAVVAQEGSPHELYENPTNVFVADFIGDANLVKAEIESVNGEMAVVSIGGIERRLPHRGLPPGEVDVAIRPMAIILANDAAAGGIEGSVLKSTYLGNHMEYTVDSPLGELFVIDYRVDAPLPRGATVSINLAERGIMLVVDES